VLRVGPSVTKVAVGDYVAGFGRSCAAHFCVAPDTNVVKLSSAKSLKPACAAGVVTLTASECMRKAQVTPGSTVVIIGASGGVGHVAVQMAKNIGACVIGICRHALMLRVSCSSALVFNPPPPPPSTSNGQFVKECGADIILLYDAGPNFDFASALNGRPIDAVIDCVGGDHYFQSACRCAYPLGASRGRYVTIVGPEPDAAKLSYASVVFKLATRYLTLVCSFARFRSHVLCSSSTVAQLWQPSYSLVLGFPNL
jgi:NADPH:quinone reductase-like Zn-dependent oxidoreductase